MGEREYNPSFAQDIEETLNEPYGQPECNDCGKQEYELTGYWINDGSGIFAEKKCLHCGAITTDGDGDFFEDEDKKLIIPVKGTKSG